MPVGVSRRGIGGAGGIGRRQISTKNSANAQQPFNFPPGSWAFSPPVDGFWKFAAWSAGGGGSVVSAGPSGAYAEITRFLRTTQVVTIGVSGESTGTNTSLTFPDGTIVTCTPSIGGSPGTASGGEVNLPGSAATGGSGANGNAGL